MLAVSTSSGRACRSVRIIAQLSRSCDLKQLHCFMQKEYEGGSEGIYGTLRTSSLAAIFVKLEEFDLDDTDVFCDVGFGLGGQVACAVAPGAVMMPS